jgi:hypothetical protein
LEVGAAQCMACNMVGRGSVEYKEGSDMVDQIGLAADVPHAAQISFPFFSHVGDQQDPAPERVPDVGSPGRLRDRLNGFRQPQERRQARAVIGDAGSAEVAFAIDRDIVPAARREDGVEMGGDGNPRRRRFGNKRSQNIAGPVDTRVPTEQAKLRSHPLSALLFKESGRRDAAELQMDVVHPLFLAREELKRLADAGALGHLADCHGRGQEIGRHNLSLAPFSLKAAARWLR